jgi:hypothetical protein
MKRKIILIVIASFMIMGVVSAASLWGTYKGNQIIRLSVDGVPVKVSDAPAIMMNGRTMIPIYLLQEAGVNYSWDSKNQTVDIKKVISNSDVINKSRIKYLKDLSTTATYYDQILNLGDMLTDLSGYFSLTYQAIANGNENGMLQNALDRLNSLINSYNDSLGYKDDISNKISGSNLSLNESVEILNDYLSSINYYKESYASLEKFYASQLDVNFNNYLNNSSKGFDSSMSGKTRASEYFYKYMDYVQKY